MGNIQQGQNESKNESVEGDSLLIYQRFLLFGESFFAIRGVFCLFWVFFLVFCVQFWILWKAQSPLFSRIKRFFNFFLDNKYFLLYNVGIQAGNSAELEKDKKRKEKTMLRMNTKKAIENAKKHFLSYYEESGKAGLLRDGRAVGFTLGGLPLNAYGCGVKLAEGGAIACYYWDQRDAIAEILEETPAEAEKYTDDQVFKTYCHLAGRVFEKLASEK